jgi:catechol 2,3-dioxygenase-like lactoylglutathione lyase family enzyme
MGNAQKLEPQMTPPTRSVGWAQGSYMTLTLDHVVIAVNDLEQATADYRELGFTVIYGGKHASGTTHNALVCFRDGTYLELLAPTGEPPKPGAMDFSHLLEHGEGVVAYALASDDLEVDAMARRQKGIRVGALMEGSRKREDGVELRWKMALIDGGMSPFLIQDITPRNLRVPDDDAMTTHDNHVIGIKRVLIVTWQITSEMMRHHIQIWSKHDLSGEETIARISVQHSPNLLPEEQAVGIERLTSLNVPEAPYGVGLRVQTAFDEPLSLEKTHNVNLTDRY